MLDASFESAVLKFVFRVRTSRGSLSDKVSWFVRIWDTTHPDVVGVGEASPLKGLSPEEGEGFEVLVSNLVQSIRGKSVPRNEKEVFEFSVAQKVPSSLQFALETALLDLIHGGTRVLFTDSHFPKGKAISINGLVWMGGMDYMLQQVVDKIAEGYRCVKLKVGGLNFEKECDILQYIRRKYFREEITIRLDANGAFKEEDALFKLGELSKFKIESIEQPLKVGSPHLAELCRLSPIPVALDEELIGVISEKEKISLLERVRPAYLVLKPTLHGGLSGCSEWIRIAGARRTGWWLTSALESDIGLNAIAQLASLHNPAIPQGLGTGKIFENNIKSPLSVESGSLFWDQSGSWTEEQEESA